MLLALLLLVLLPKMKEEVEGVEVGVEFDLSPKPKEEVLVPNMMSNNREELNHER